MVNANQVARQLFVNGPGTMPTKPKRPVLPTVEGIPSLTSAFSEEQYRKGIAALKSNKAEGMITDAAYDTVNHRILIP